MWILGYSTIFLVRQLMEMKNRTRVGSWTVLHGQFNAQVDTKHMVALAARRSAARQV
jgi:hypothetical protein